jgi:mannose-1-phosphate guanylyltransferase/mannose-6-phosphate isomerase
MPERFVLVLAGGRGERFWPWSRPDRPKQLLPLARGGRTLLEATLERALKLAAPERIVVLTARDLSESVRRACPPGVRVIGEPVGRNTAPAVAAAARLFSAEGGDPAFAVLPSDHAIDDTGAFVADFEAAFRAAEKDELMVIFGIPPTSPDTNFGYVRMGAALDDRLHRVAAFTEKPDRARAEAWFEAGGYGWNSGMFVWRCSTFTKALRASRPAIAGAIGSLAWKDGDAGFEASLDGVFPGIESVSVDYAVLEQAPNVVVMEASFDWDDLGSWGAWARRQPRDGRGNVVFGDAIVIDCDGCVVVGEGGTAAALGLRDAIVVHANGATLSCPLQTSSQVRRVSDAARARAGT